MKVDTNSASPPEPRFTRPFAIQTAIVPEKSSAVELVFENAIL